MEKSDSDNEDDNEMEVPHIIKVQSKVSGIDNEKQKGDQKGGDQKGGGQEGSNQKGDQESD